MLTIQPLRSTSRGSRARYQIPGWIIPCQLQFPHTTSVPCVMPAM